MDNQLALDVAFEYSFLRSLVAFLDEVLAHALIDRLVIVRHDDGTEMYSAHVAQANPCQLRGHFLVFLGVFLGDASVQKAGVGRICSTNNMQ
jgi:hypothetical protein